MDILIPLISAVAVGLIAFVLILAVAVPMALGLFDGRR
jgi:hypothetical protein